MKSQTNKNSESEMLAKVVAQAMSDKKATDIVILDLRQVAGAPSSFFVICTGNSPLHTDAIADAIHENVKKIFDINATSTEGYDTAEWILMDYFDVVAHVFVAKTREFYRLEDLWADGKRTEVQ
ncbi:MAG: ribosome silencing factor [Bacteroidales bacterium]|nr:ribosome silencing factor [Bacteroidales bacterium]